MKWAFFTALAVLSSALLAEDNMPQTDGPRLLVAYDEANGGVKSLVLAGDWTRYRMPFARNT